MKRWVLTLLLILFTAIFLVSGYFVVSYYWESNKQKSEFDDLAAIKNQATQPAVQTPVVTPSVSDPDAPTDAVPEVTEPAGPVLVEVTDPETGEIVEMLPEFAQLYTMNPDLIGWITIEDTTIDYPVMHHPEYRNYYLYLNFKEEYSRHGSIYIREECDVFAPSDNITIYGHRMGDGTMFNHLHKYIDEDFYADHNLIQFNTLREYHTYEIFAIFRISANASSKFMYHQFVDAADEAEFNEFVQKCKDLSLYDTGVEVAYGDKLITLSTCEYTNVNGRLVVVAKRIC